MQSDTLLVRARIGLAFFLLMAVIGLVCALIFHPVTLTNDAKEIVGSLIAQLVALLIFTIHALFQQHVSMPNPIQPESPANPEKVN